MNWGEIQIETLKKMYLNNDNLVVSDLDEYRENKKYRTYLFAMPQAANEAIRKILDVKPTIKSYTLKYKDSTNKYELKKVIPGYKKLFEIVYNGTKKPNYYFEGDNVLVVNNWSESDETFTIYYESYHDIIKTSTSASASINVDRELIPLIPLYIAGELYKDDDVQQSTIWMNEFETALSEVKSNSKDINSNPREITTVYGVDW